MMSAGAGAQVSDAANFYAGKTIRLIVGYGPGGGYDTYARMLAPHLEARTGATVIVENRPGGGGLVALNQVVAAKGDGLTLMIANAEGAVLAQLVGKEGVRYDLRRVTWLARVSSEARILMWSAKSPFRTLADGLHAPRTIKWAASGKSDSIADVISFASVALGLDSRIIIGYKGSKEAALAAIRGEADGISVSASSAKKYSQGNKLIAAAVLGRERSPLFPDLQTVFEMVDLPPDKAWWLDFRARMTEIGRAVITTPGVAQGRAAFLRAVFEEILSDPEVHAEARAKRRILSFAPADRLRDLVDETLSSLDEEKLAEVRRVVLERYY